MLRPPIPRESFLLMIRDFRRKVVIVFRAARQYCASLGKVDNCQIGVSMTYVGQGFAWPYAMELFVPQSWDNPDDPECVDMRKKTYMPEDVHHRAKWQMALDLIDKARSDGAPHRAVVADSWYGDITDFRQGSTTGKSAISSAFTRIHRFFWSLRFLFNPIPRRRKEEERENTRI